MLAIYHIIDTLDVYLANVRQEKEQCCDNAYSKNGHRSLDLPVEARCGAHTAANNIGKGLLLARNTSHLIGKSILHRSH